MEGHLEDGLVRVGADARERFYDSRGYGRPDGDGLRLAPVEAAHLLYRGDLEAVDGQGFREFLGREGLAARFLVYMDLRERGFYLSPAREGWVDDPDDVDFVVFPRGKGPWDGAVAHRVRVILERGAVAADSLGDVVLAVVDEESELTYLETDRPDVAGSSTADPGGGATGTLLDDRALLWDPPGELYDRGFYGQPLDEGVSALQLSLVEAAYLAGRGIVDFEGGRPAVVDRGRAVEGDRFDRRLTVYAALRDRGVVPKTGFKFGADFRTYADVDSVDDLGHSQLLVRVLPRDHVFSPRDLALDVRLAHGVRKRMVFALTDGEGRSPSGSEERSSSGNRPQSGDSRRQSGDGEDVAWVSVGRLTP